MTWQRSLQLDTEHEEIADEPCDQYIKGLTKIQAFDQAVYEQCDAQCYMPRGRGLDSLTLVNLIPAVWLAQLIVASMNIYVTSFIKERLMSFRYHQ